MKFAGHIDPWIFLNKYASSTSTVDGISNILKDLPCWTDYIDMFCGWSMKRYL